VQGAFRSAGADLSVGDAIEIDKPDSMIFTARSRGNAPRPRSNSTRRKCVFARRRIAPVLLSPKHAKQCSEIEPHSRYPFGTARGRSTRYGAQIIPLGGQDNLNATALTNTRQSEAYALAG
jgi:hypothetical protein